MLNWFATNARELPWRRTRDPYAIWVSEIMLQQTQVKTVIPYWERWLRELPTIENLAHASADKIHKLWEGLGYYTRVRNMQKAAQQILSLSRSRRRKEAESSGNSKSSASSPRRLPKCEFPQTFDAILALPGIGRYTAGAICSIAFNQPTPILDGNVIRVLTRIHGIKTNPREKQTNTSLWQLAEQLVVHAKTQGKGRDSALRCPDAAARRPSQNNSCSHFNQSLMELGALICTPRSPSCAACPVQQLCVARKDNLQDQLPNLGKREAATKRRFIAFVVERYGKFLVCQRPASVVNAHLWEFPNVEAGARVCDPQQSAAKELGLRTTAAKPLHTIKHSITRYRITLEAWHAELASPFPKIPGRWLTPKQLHQLAFSSAHKKILQTVAKAKTQKLKKT